MRQTVGWGAAAAIAVAAAVGLSSRSGEKQSAEPSVISGHAPDAGAPKGGTKDKLPTSPCDQIEKRLDDFLGAGIGKVPAPPSCYVGVSMHAKVGGAKKVQISKAATLKFVIATLPDPVHSQFALSFDRATEAIQQAAADEGYLYDSSWMPWDEEDPKFRGLADQDAFDTRKDAREDQPGIILFRQDTRNAAQVKGLALADAAYPNGVPLTEAPYTNGLVVLIVGEEATWGIHRTQFENALAWIATLQPSASTYSVLGPTFSGSLPSLARLLSGPGGVTKVSSARGHAPTPWQTAPPRRSLRPTPAVANPGPTRLPLAVYSGGVTSGSGADSFVQAMAGRVEFKSFQQRDEDALYRYCEYLRHSGFDLAKLAIVSEDETSYGSFQDASDKDPPRPKDKDLRCDLERAAKLYYPRDISSLRDAYQKQSIFKSDSSSSQLSIDAFRRLTADLADPEHAQHDTVRNYSGIQTALSQEAVLEQIVYMLRVHKSEYVILRSSNPLDQLFLSHFLRIVYPEGRIVLLGADLLMGRETGAQGLNGIMTLSTYPLLPSEPHWAKSFSERNSHSHRVFANNGAEGVYMAARFLVHPEPWRADPNIAEDVTETSRAAPIFLPSNCDRRLDLPDYAEPFWTGESVGWADCREPPTWLAVLGRGGFWPLAALTTDTPNAGPCDDKRGMARFPCQSRETWRQSIETWRRSMGNLYRLVAPSRDVPFFEPPENSPIRGGDSCDRARQWKNPGIWPKMPLSMKVCLLGILALAIFHLVCCWRASITVKPVHRAHFVAVSGATHPSLILIGSILITVLAVLAGWGYGALSPYGEPVSSPWPYRFYLFFIWLLAGVSLSLNVLLEYVRSLAVNAPPTGGLKSPGRQARKLRSDLKHWWDSRNKRLKLLWRGRKIVWRNRRPIWDDLIVLRRSMLVFVLATVGFYGLIGFMLEGPLYSANRLPTYWRAMTLNSGVSPVVPLLALTIGLYLWFWHTLQGVALFGRDRPRLPCAQSLQFTFGGKDRKWLRLFSEEAAARPIETLCRPFDAQVLIVAVTVFFTLLLLGIYVAGDNVPVRGLGSVSNARLFCVGMDLCVSVMLAGAWQLLRIWLRLRETLQLMDRLRLRRTLAAIKGVSWGSVWKMSGNVLDTRYKMLTNQLETLTHLTNSLQALQGGPPRQARAITVGPVSVSLSQTVKPPASESNQANINQANITRWLAYINAVQAYRVDFADWYCKHYQDWRERDQSTLRRLQRKLANVAGMLLSDMLLQAWRKEKNSMMVEECPRVAPKTGKEPESNHDHETANASLEPHVCNAEEFVCLVFLSYIQNVLGRTRSLAMSIVWLYVAVAVAVASYPFDPRPLISVSMVVLFLAVGGVIFVVYSQMHRDVTLSLATDTAPGELGSEFWMKLLGFCAGPLLGLLATLFPGLLDFIFA